MANRTRIDASAAAAREAMLAALGANGSALFVADLAASLQLPPTGVDTLLASLEDEGVLLVRDHYCADPHLEGADLRIAALVDHATGRDGVAGAIEAIESTWSAWLAAYLAGHRCS
jgi:hypothetical protein